MVIWARGRYRKVLAARPGHSDRVRFEVTIQKGRCSAASAELELTEQCGVLERWGRVSL